jgi:hypothetical protein
VSSDSAEVAVLRALAEVSEAFLEIAATLRSLPGVRTVSHPCSMRTEEWVSDGQYRVGQGDGFRFEWYAEGEFDGGRAISFGLELSHHDGEYIIDAAVRANEAQEERMLLELPRRYAIDPVDLVGELRSQAGLLLGRRDEGVALFLPG